MAALSTEEGPVLADAELAADKVLALAGRAEVRDFVDFEGLTARFDLHELCELAASKDLGFRRQHLLAALEYFDEINPKAFNAKAFNLNPPVRWGLRRLARPLERPPDVGECGLR